MSSGTCHACCITATTAAQYLSIRYTERLAEAGIEASVGSVGDSYDTQSTMGHVGGGQHHDIEDAIDGRGTA